MVRIFRWAICCWFAIHLLLLRKTWEGVVFSAGLEEVWSVVGSLLPLDLRLPTHPGAGSTGVSEGSSHSGRGILLHQELSKCWGDFSWYLFHILLNVICKYAGLREWNYKPPSVGSHLKKWLDFSPPESAVNSQRSVKPAATQQLWVWSWFFQWIKMKLGDTGRLYGLCLEIWVCVRLYCGVFLVGCFFLVGWFFLVVVVCGV